MRRHRVPGSKGGFLAGLIIFPLCSTNIGGPQQISNYRTTSTKNQDEALYWAYTKKKAYFELKKLKLPLKYLKCHIVDCLVGNWTETSKYRKLEGTFIWGL